MQFNSKEIILRLIKADFCNNKLIFGLENAGMELKDFHGDLDIIILFLMGFDLKNREDELHDFYYEKMKSLLLAIEVKHFREHLNRLAEEMYEELRQKI
jgi:hypothetical protein